MAWVVSIHRPGFKTKLFSPALLPNPSNSRGLKSTLFNRLHEIRDGASLNFDGGLLRLAHGPGYFSSFGFRADSQAWPLAVRR